MAAIGRGRLGSMSNAGGRRRHRGRHLPLCLAAGIQDVVGALVPPCVPQDARELFVRLRGKSQGQSNSFRRGRARSAIRRWCVGNLTCRDLFHPCPIYAGKRSVKTPSISCAQTSSLIRISSIVELPLDARDRCGRYSYKAKKMEVVFPICTFHEACRKRGPLSVLVPHTPCLFPPWTSRQSPYLFALP